MGWAGAIARKSTDERRAGEAVGRVEARLPRPETRPNRDGSRYLRRVAFFFAAFRGAAFFTAFFAAFLATAFTAFRAAFFTTRLGADFLAAPALLTADFAGADFFGAAFPDAAFGAAAFSLVREAGARR